jgi:hypothetical protein
MLCPLNIVVFVKLNSKIQKTKKKKYHICFWKLFSEEFFS